MLKKFNEIKKLEKDCEKTAFLPRDNEGNTIINISVKDDSNFLSPYSCAGKPVISTDTAEFLKHEISTLKQNEKVHFVIESEVIDQNEQHLYPQAVKNYYTTKVKTGKTELKRNALASLIMLILGIMVFTTIIILNSYNAQTILLNVLDVVAWVFIWEAVDLFVFKRTALKKEHIINLKLLTAKFTFKNQ